MINISEQINFTSNLERVDMHIESVSRQTGKLRVTFSDIPMSEIEKLEHGSYDVKMKPSNQMWDQETHSDISYKSKIYLELDEDGTYTFSEEEGVTQYPDKLELEGEITLDPNWKENMKEALKMSAESVRAVYEITVIDRGNGEILINGQVVGKSEESAKFNMGVYQDLNQFDLDIDDVAIIIHQLGTFKLLDEENKEKPVE